MRKIKSFLAVLLALVMVITIAPVNRASADGTEVPKISASKELTDENNDGVYELALNVTGSAESSSSTNVDKSNVVIVIDTSGSMGGDVATQRISYTYDSSTYRSSNTYQAYIDGQWRNLSRNNSGQWTYRRNSRTYVYSGTDVYWQVSNRMDATKAAAYNLVDTLLSYNKTGTAADGTRLDDIIEITLMSFSGNSNVNGSTSINDAKTLKAKSTSASDLKEAIRNMSSSGGTNWEAALRKAKTEADAYASQSGETTSVIFLTDGMPTFYLNNADSQTAGNGGTGTEDRDNVHTCWEQAADDAKAIVDAKYKFYSIFAYGSNNVAFNNDSNRTPADYLRSLTNYAYDGDGDPLGDYSKTDKTYDDKYFFDASDTEALVEAFESIASTITNNVGFGGVEIDDGVTLGVTNTSVTVNGSVNEKSFTYTVKDKNGNTVYTVKFSVGTATFTAGGKTATDSTADKVVTKINPDDPSTWITSDVYSVEIDGVTYKMSPASINETNGMIEWDLAGLGILQNGYTYTLTFDVWPNQWAYDLVADINNGIITKEEALASIEDPVKRAQVEQALVNNGDGTYAIYTNYSQNVTYYQADEETAEDGTSTTTYGPKQTKPLVQPDALKLTSSKMDLNKLWADELDESQLQKLLYKEDGAPTEYKVPLKVWKADTLSALNSLVEADATGTQYKDVTLGWNDKEEDYIWSDSLDVAPGTMILLENAAEMGIDTSDTSKQVTYDGKKYFILETGHYYTVTEVNPDWHFDLVTIVYHPMLVDGDLSNVTFKEDGTVEDIVPMTTVDATNTLRGGINLKKVVLDPEGKEYPTEDEFDFTVVLNNDEAIFTGNNIPWYGVNGMYYHDADGNYIAESVTGDTDGDGLDDDGNIPEVSNGGKTATYTLTINSTDDVRINNVPINTTFTITEGEADGFKLDKIVHKIKLNNDEEDGEGTITLDERKITGTIEPNRENNITFKNKMEQFPAFYVYHSSDNTIEKVYVNDERVTRTTDENELSIYTFDIVNETKNGTLYGGYYKSYKGAVASDAQINETAETGRLTYTDNKATDNAGAIPYSYAYIKDRNRDVWGNDFYTVNGKEMNPVPNGVYYLKEVPEYYSLPYTHYTYNKSDKKLRNMWYISSIDDLKYNEAGFCITTFDADGKTIAKIVNTLTVKTATGGSTTTLTPVKLFGNKGGTGNGVQAGYLSYWDASKLIKANTTSVYTPYWKTMDGVYVTGTKTRTVSFNNGKIGSGGMRTADADCTTPYPDLD